MGRCCTCSGAILAALNVATLLIAFLLAAAGAAIALQPATGCDRFMQTPLFFSGVFLFVVSLLGILGACCRVSCMLWLYLTVMFLLIVALVCFTAFAFVVTNKSAGEVVSGQGYKDYRLGDYSHWLQNMVRDQQAWGSIASCMKEARVCGGSPTPTLMDPTDFYKTKLSSVQSGCCKRPAGCSSTPAEANATVLVKPKRALLADESDCKAWNSNPLELCFACNSCKAGFLSNIQRGWKGLAVFNVGLLLILVIIYCVGCCAVRSNRRDSYRRYRAGYRA